ncbi:hypothetical protein [Rubellimicrobium arenae]|uniref:hypothetical protein n=1 Tax=Rubellimicrobium arenae TaxID=2817372 RepID=UPI001FEE893A|nr:hypothetical protein [Rubellimicrobium arenae]
MLQTGVWRDPLRAIWPRRRVLAAAVAASGATAILGGWLRHVLGTRQLSDAELADIYATPAPPPGGPLRVYHLGHSLVGRDMPAMLAQLASAGHRYESQLGWGATLKAHWEGKDAVAGFDEENAHSRFRDARDALSSGDYDAFIFTEMVEIRDAIRYHDSSGHALKWMRLARNGNPDIRVYLYETWHALDTPDGWLERLDGDLDQSWDRGVLRPALSVDAAVRPAHIIPAGQILARFVREVEARGGIDEAGSRKDLFARDADGTLDPIHLNDLGNYLVALAHFAVLYRQDPTGLPRELRRADSTAAAPPSVALARLMQEIVWQVVTEMPATGVQVETAA